MPWSHRGKNGPRTIPAQLIRNNETGQKHIFKPGVHLRTSLKANSGVRKSVGRETYHAQTGIYV